MKIVVHLKADVFDWSESPTSINKNFLVTSNKEIQSHIEEIIGERWDFQDGVGKEEHRQRGTQLDGYFTREEM